MTQPNIVFINCDDLGYGDLGCYGSSLNKTPALDQLANEGIRFTSLYMGSPVCSPSRAALLTGCYPPRISFGEFDGWHVLFPGQGLGLPPTEISIAKVLSEAGYRTQMIGKWHCGDQPGFLPTNHGFDHYFGLPYSNDMGRQSNTPEWLVLPPLPLLHDDDVIEQQPDQSLLTERYVQEAIDFIRADSPKPFFLYLAHMYVHLPIYVKQEFLDNSENGSYGAAVESIDWATSVIMNELHSLGLDENTIVIFTSDNGSLGNVHPPFGDRKELIGGSNLPLRGAKGTTWEGGQRVPAIVRWKGKIEAGRVCDELLTAMDFYPTLANLCGAKVPQDRIIDGIDAQAVWFDAQAKSQHEHFVYYRANGLEAIRDRQYKLHFGRGNQDVFELYDIAHDVSETVNVYDQYPEVVASLTKAANHYRQTLGDDRTGSVGTQVRPIGRVEDPRPLTEYDSRNPYVIAEYDLPDRG